jgi:ribosomal protein L31E
MRFLIENSQDRQGQKVEDGTGTKRIYQIELNLKVAEGCRSYKKAERSLKKVKDSREKREKVDEGR